MREIRYLKLANAFFKMLVSLEFVTFCYVIMNISIAWTINKLKIT